MSEKEEKSKQKLAKTYPPETGGRLAIQSVPIVHANTSLGDVVAMLEKEASSFDSINYVYIVDGHDVLKGVASIKDVLVGNPRIFIKDIMTKDLVVAHPYTDQERIAHQALKASIKAVPIVQKNGVFMGVVPSDVILEILHTEYFEDMAHMAGVPNMPYARDMFKVSVWTHVRHRLPWLVIGLLGGVIAAGVVSFFEETLTEHIILASFIPLIMYMGGSSLSQAQSFFIRDLAFTPNLDFREYMRKQAKIIFIVASVLGLLMYALSVFVFQGASEIAHVLGVALFAVLISTLLTSFFIPYLFFIYKKDPADGSGPLSTIVQDLFGISLYFLIALTLL